MAEPFIISVSFVRPVAPPNGVDGTVPYVTSADAALTLAGDCVKVAWKGQPVFMLVPLTNVRWMGCAETPVEQPKPQPAPQSQARKGK